MAIHRALALNRVRIVERELSPFIIVVVLVIDSLCATKYRSIAGSRACIQAVAANHESASSKVSKRNARV